MVLYCAFAAVTALLPTVVARKVSSGGGGGGGSVDVNADTSSFHPPPIEAAKLAAYCIFLLVALLQLEIFITVALRPGPRRFPAASAAAALTILGIAYVLGIAEVVTSYTDDEDGIPRISFISAVKLETASTLFYAWTDPAIFATVAFILYSRYRTVQKSSSIALIAFAGAAGALFMLMVIFIAVAAGVLDAALITSARNISFDEDGQQIRTSNNLFYTFVAFSTLGTILLAVAAFLVKARTHKDTVTSLTLFAIVPFLILHAITQLILVIVQALVRFPMSIDFATIFLYGLAYIGVTSVLAFLLARPQLWDAASPAPSAASPTHQPGQTPSDTLRGETEAKQVPPAMQF